MILELKSDDPNHWASLANISKTKKVTCWVVMPCTDRGAGLRAGTLMLQRAGISNVVVLLAHDIDREGFIAMANKAFANTSSEFFAYVAQDAFPGRDWLKRATYALADPKQGLCALNDGKWAGALASFGVVRRTWAQQNYEGLLFHPGYKRHYADVELTLLAKNDKKYRYDANAVMMEADWNKDTSAVNAEDKAQFFNRVNNELSDVLSQDLKDLVLT